jgi:hypothetical protein
VKDYMIANGFLTSRHAGAGRKDKCLPVGPQPFGVLVAALLQALVRLRCDRELRDLVPSLAGGLGS